MKKKDLQGLRGVAIISVILFHFFPSIFPNGYVGVDQFFVLSGYLMTLIFGSREINPMTILLFYYRRIKRIVPLYLLIIIIAFILMFFILPSTFRGLNKDTALRAVLFISNLPRKQTDNDYFVLLEQAADLFTHTWSLSVELQFYLLVPSIFILFSSGFWYAAASYFLIFSLSLGYHLFSDSITSFNSVFSRIWQFQIGMVAFYCGAKLEKYYNKSNKIAADEESLIEKEIEEEDEIDLEIEGITSKNRKKMSIDVLFWFFFFILMFCSFYPFHLNSKAIRPLSTFVSGFVILFGTHVKMNPLNLGKLVYLGDISYSLYLIHWPMYVWIKYTYKDNITAYFLTILAAVILAICITETFEKWYQTLDKLKIFVLLTVLYFILAQAFINFDHLSKFADSDEELKTNTTSALNITPEEAIKLNADYDRREYPNLVIKNCYPNRKEHGFCSFAEGKGTEKILILGNSYTANLASLVNEAFVNIGKNISKFSNSYCEVLIQTTGNPSFNCKGSFNSYMGLTEYYQPDILFIIARSFKAEFPFQDVTNVEDTIFNTMKDTLDKYESWTKKKIYILNSLPKVRSDHIKILNSMIKDNKFDQGTDYGVPQTFQNGQKRLNRLAQLCKKCQLFDFNTVLTNGKGIPIFFDQKTKLSYYTSGSHLTETGKMAVLPIFKALAANYTTP